MKKTLVSALTTALVVGAASTTFAAANPFSDVPADHWAYDAVTQLAADGVIEGYGDTTFQGDKSITRYEMAQMVAKAMAKTDVSAADKAMIDKLAAEFADELNNLGVRVSNLEKHADMVKWTGEARYRYYSERNKAESDHRKNTDQLQFRLFPTAEVNDHWQVKARLTGTLDMSKDAGNDGDMDLTYAYAQGNYGHFQTKLGKQELYSYADDGLILDDFFSGAQVKFGNQLTATLEAGRWSGVKTSEKNATTNVVTLHDAAANYQGIDLGYAPSKLRVGAAYRHLNSDAFKMTNTFLNSFDATKARYKNNTKSTSDDANIWSAGLGYNFDGNWDLFGSYAKNTSADNYNTAHNIQLKYKGAEKANAGTWGAWAAYHYLGQNVAFAPTWDSTIKNSKGWEFGAEYSPLHNTLLQAIYFTGKNIADNSKDADMLFGRVSFFF